MGGEKIMWKAGPGVMQLFALIVACVGWSVFDSSAQSYPDKPIRIVVGYVAGGAADTTARLVAQVLSERFGQSVVVENRPGAGGMIADERVAKSLPDGYTLLVTAGSATIQRALHAKLTYDLERDLAPVTLVTIVPFVLVVHPSVPARNLKQLIALARAKAGQLRYGSSGVGSSAHLAGELFKLMAKVNIIHVPYKGGAESVIATAAGHIEMNYPTITSALPLLGAGKLTPLAISSTKRASSMPSLPTIDESGVPGYDRFAWYGLFAPAGVPKDIIARLNSVLDKTVNNPEMTKTFNDKGLEPRINTPEQFAAFVHRDIVENANLVKLSGAKFE